MAKRRPPRILKWREHWTLFYFDHTSGKEKRIRCETLGAETAEGRKKLLQEYLAKEVADKAEVQRRGGLLAYDTPLVDALKDYLADVDRRKKMRLANPSSREGLAEQSAKMIRESLQRFFDWLKAEGRESITTGQLDVSTLNGFFGYLAITPTKQGRREVMRSAATINMYRRNIRAAINFIADLRPPRFPDPLIFKRAVKAAPTDAEKSTAFSPAILQRFLSAALAREESERKIEVRRRKGVGGKAEAFEQTAPSTAATPVSRLFLLLALTGARLGEILALKWEHIDLDRGRITIFAEKTGRKRIVPLTGAPEGEIAPKLVALLRQWREENRDREFVLPHGDLDAPIFPKYAWQAANKAAKLARIGPQMLRRNFVSYAASLGVPPAVAALWSGHSATVAEKWYRQQVLDRATAATVEDAMGLGKVIAGLMNDGTAISAGNSEPA